MEQLIVGIKDPSINARSLDDLKLQLKQWMRRAEEIQVLIMASPQSSPQQQQQSQPQPQQQQQTKSRTHCKSIQIKHGDTGHTYESLFGAYLKGAVSVVIEDPYIRSPHQIYNFLRFIELLVKVETIKQIELITLRNIVSEKSYESEKQLQEIVNECANFQIKLKITYSETLHDRQIKLQPTGYVMKIGRGLDFYQKAPSKLSIGYFDFSLRPCLETNVDIFLEK